MLAAVVVWWSRASRVRVAAAWRHIALVGVVADQGVACRDHQGAHVRAVGHPRVPGGAPSLGVDDRARDVDGDGDGDGVGGRVGR